MKMLGTFLLNHYTDNHMKNNHTYLFTLLVAVALMFANCSGKTYIDELRDIDVNGVNIVYQVKGNTHGLPVILLHGNGGKHDDLSVMVNQLDSAGYLVYALDSRGQGANAPLSEYHYTDMAEDVFSFIQALHLGHPAIFGWSDGGNIALQLEVLHPGTAYAIITSGANIFPEGLTPELWAEFSQLKLQDSVPALTRMMLYEPQMTFCEMQTIPCHALIVAGEYDLIDSAHTRAIAEHIPHGQALFIPGEDHGSHIYKSPVMGKVLLEYFQEINY